MITQRLKETGGAESEKGGGVVKDWRGFAFLRTEKGILIQLRLRQR